MHAFPAACPPCALTDGQYGVLLDGIWGANSKKRICVEYYFNTYQLGYCQQALLPIRITTTVVSHLIIDRYLRLLFSPTISSYYSASNEMRIATFQMGVMYKPALLQPREFLLLDTQALSILSSFKETRSSNLDHLLAVIPSSVAQLASQALASTVDSSFTVATATILLELSYS